MSFFRACGSAIRAMWLAALTRPGLNLVAILASTFGSGICCLLLAWAMGALMGAKQWASIAIIAYGLLATVSITMFGLQKLLAGKQSVEAEILSAKLKISQGGEDDPSTGI